MEFTHRRLATCRPYKSDTNTRIRTPYIVDLVSLPSK